MAGRDGITGRVRETAERLKLFQTEDIQAVLITTNYRDARRIRNVIFDMRRHGEIEIVEPGRYRYIGRQGQRTKMDMIWHLVRSLRRFEATEIECLSGARRWTVLEYLRCLKDLGYLEKISKTLWRLVNDPGPQTPANAERFMRLRVLRARKAEI